MELPDVLLYGAPAPGLPCLHGLCEALPFTGSFMAFPSPRGSSQCPLPGHWRSEHSTGPGRSLITGHLTRLWSVPDWPQMSKVSPQSSSLKLIPCHLTGAFRDHHPFERTVCMH